MVKQAENEVQGEKKSRKSKEPALSVRASAIEPAEVKTTIKITFDGEVAQRILKCEAELKERLSKPDMGKILGSEILKWADNRWHEIVEENTDIEFYFAQIRKCSDKSKSTKLLKALSEKLESENVTSVDMPAGLPIAQGEAQQNPVDLAESG